MPQEVATEPKKRSRWPAVVRLLLVALAFVPAYLGQMQIKENPGRTGVLFLVGFVMVLVASAWRRERLPSLPVPPPDPHLRSRWWWLVPAAALGSLSYYAEFSPKMSSRVSMILWLSSLAFLILPFWIRRSRDEAPPAGEEEADNGKPVRRFTPPKWTWAEIAGFGLLMVVAVAFRLPYLERFPVMIHNDEANCGLMSQEIMREWQQGRVDWFRTRSFFGFNTLGFVPSAFFQTHFPPNLHGHRLTNVLLSLAALACFYLLIREVAGRSAALLSTGLAAASHFSVHWSRTGIHCGHAAFLAAICGWLLWKSVTTGRARWFILSGISLVACTVTYNAALFVPLWLALVLMTCWVSSSRFRKRYTVSLLLLVFSLLTTLAPLAAVYTRGANSFVNRSGSMVFTKDPVMVRHLKHSFGEDYLPAVLRNNFRQALLVFGRVGDSNLQYGYHSSGLLDDLSAAMLVLGLGVAIARLSHFAYWPILLGTTLVWGLGAVLTTDSPQYSRIAGLAFLVQVFPALWGREVYGSARKALGRSGAILSASLLVCGLTGVAYANFRLYFIQHDKRYEREAQFSAISRDARDNGPTNITYVLDKELPTDFTHRSHLFVAGRLPFRSFSSLNQVQLPSDPQLKTATFLISERKKSQARELMELYPGGRMEERYLAFREDKPLYLRCVVPLDKEISAPASNTGGIGPTPKTGEGIGPFSIRQYEQGWGELGINRSSAGAPLTVGGRRFESGLGTHAPSSISLELNGSFSSFAGACGVDDEVGEKGSVVFKILSGINLLYESPVMLGSSPEHKFDISVEGLSRIDLLVDDGGDNMNHDHADWLALTLR